MQLKNINFKQAGLLFAVLSLFLFIAFFHAALSSAFPVTHNEAVPGNSNYPESYTIQLSPAAAFAWTWSVWRVLGIIVWAGVGLYLVLMGNDALGTREGTVGSALAKSHNLVFYGAMLLAAVLLFAGHSNVAAGNNTKTIDPVRYERVKDSKDSLKNLFDKKNLIR